MIGGWLLRLLDNALTDEQLRAVASSEVNVLVLLLFRDMFRHNADLLRPGTRDTRWVETLFREIADKLGLPAERFCDDGQPYELDEITNCDWARALAAPLGLPPEKLFACHSAIVNGARDEFSQVQ
jgi:hypothetical protein